MTEFISAIIAGISDGVLFGMLGFAIVLLYRATFTLVFAVPYIAMFTTFMTYKLYSTYKLDMALAVIIGTVAASVIGVVLYWLVIRPRQGGALNTVIRTLAIYVVLYELANIYWGPGQPFRFSVLPPVHTLSIHGVTVSVNAIIVIGFASIVAVMLAVFFRYSITGLFFRAIAERPDTARLLGINVRRMTMIAWAIAAVVALFVGLLTAPSSYVSSNMMDAYMLYAFAGALIGGLTSWSGVLVGGIMVGVASDLATLYGSGALAVLVVFALLLSCLVFRPYGLFGTPAAVRL